MQQTGCKQKPKGWKKKLNKKSSQNRLYEKETKEKVKEELLGSPEPYRQKKEYPEPAPWRQPSQTGKGGKAPKPPRSPTSIKDTVTVNQQNYQPVERPSRQKVAERRKLPPHLLDGKGQEAASSSVTVPVHNQTAAKAEAEITATYGDFALKTVL